MNEIVAVSAGHHPKAQGASNTGYTEYGQMSVLAGMLVSRLTRKGLPAYLIGSGTLQRKIDWVNDLGPAVAIDLHLNAGGGKGHETLYCPGSTKGLELAECVNEAFTQLGIPNRGVKEGWYKMNKKNGPDAFLVDTCCPAIITEMYFIDNDQTREDLADNYMRLAAVAEFMAIQIEIYLRS